MNVARSFFFLLLSGCCFMNHLNAKVRVDNLSDYNFGMIRPGYFPIKESTVWVSANHYTLVIYGQSDTNLSFHLSQGIYKVPYTISWKDNAGNYASLLPGTMSTVFKGSDLGQPMPATLKMQIQGNFPKPGHYSDTLTLIITPT